MLTNDSLRVLVLTTVRCFRPPWCTRKRLLVTRGTDWTRGGGDPLLELTAVV